MIVEPKSECFLQTYPGFIFVKFSSHNMFFYRIYPNKFPLACTFMREGFEVSIPPTRKFHQNNLFKFLYNRYKIFLNIFSKHSRNARKNITIFFRMFPQILPQLFAIPTEPIAFDRFQTSTQGCQPYGFIRRST